MAPPLSKMKAESSARSLFSKIKEKQRKLTRNFLAKQRKTISRYPYSFTRIRARYLLDDVDPDLHRVIYTSIIRVMPVIIEFVAYTEPHDKCFTNQSLFMSGFFYSSNELSMNFDRTSSDFEVLFQLSVSRKALFN